MSQLAVNTITDANGGNTATINSMTPTADSLQGFRNRIINGDMRIDQRNAGASVTATSVAIPAYTVDRWAYYVSQASKFTIQQNAGSVTPPTGFTNYLGCTSSATTSLGSSDFYLIQQKIEGLNCADLGWGTASAASVTLSFWVRASLTGTFGGAVTNSAQTRSLAFSYTISAANTWEQKSITIAGDTSGTWPTNNGVGIWLMFSLGMGSGLSGAANTWGSAVLGSVTGATSVVGTNGATFYITGVQLEVGSVATPFERRPYSVEFDMCRRYYERFSTANAFICVLSAYNTNDSYGGLNYYEKRATPTFTAVGGANTYTVYGNDTSFQRQASNLVFQDFNLKNVRVGVNNPSTFVKGYAYFLQFSNTTSSYIEVSSEL